MYYPQEAATDRRMIRAWATDQNPHGAHASKNTILRHLCIIRISLNSALAHQLLALQSISAGRDVTCVRVKARPLPVLLVTTICVVPGGRWIDDASTLPQLLPLPCYQRNRPQQWLLMLVTILPSFEQRALDREGC